MTGDSPHDSGSVSSLWAFLQPFKQTHFLQRRVQHEVGSPEQPMAGRGAARSAEAGHHRRSDPPVAALQRDGGEVTQMAGGCFAPCEGSSGRKYDPSAASSLHAGRCPGKSDDTAVQLQQQGLLQNEK